MKLTFIFEYNYLNISDFVNIIKIGYDALKHSISKILGSDSNALKYS